MTSEETSSDTLRDDEVERRCAECGKVDPENFLLHVGWSEWRHPECLEEAEADEEATKLDHYRARLGKIDYTQGVQLQELVEHTIEYAAQLEERIENLKAGYEEALRLASEEGVAEEFLRNLKSALVGEDVKTATETIEELRAERDEARAERDRLHAQLERVCSEYEATWRVVREEGGMPPSVVGARESLREVKLGETIERIRREAGMAVHEMWLDWFHGSDEDVPTPTKAEVEATLAEGDDQEGD